MHIKPGVGKPRPVGQAIVDNLFATNQSGRIPLVGVTGTHGKTAVARLIAHLLYLSGAYTGLACSDGLFQNRRQVQKTDAANWSAGRRLLLNRAVEAAVIENGAEVILGQGLAYDRCSVGVITNIASDDEDLSSRQTALKALAVRQHPRIAALESRAETIRVLLAALPPEPALPA